MNRRSCLESILILKCALVGPKIERVLWSSESELIVYLAGCIYVEHASGLCDHMVAKICRLAIIYPVIEWIADLLHWL